MYYIAEVLEGILYYRYTQHTYDITILARIPIGITMVALWSRQVFSYYYTSNI